MRPNYLLQRLQISENSLLMILATVVGISTGAGVWLYREGIDRFHHFFREQLPHDILPAWNEDVLLVLSLGIMGVLIGWIMQRFVGEERHHGVAGIIEATLLAGGRLRYKVIPIKTVASVLSLGVGASVGPEDPSVQLGANLGSFWGQKLHLSEERTRLLVAAGAASAISAAFNAPIAGVFFALEVILSDFTTGSVGVVVLSSVMASVFMQSASQVSPELGILHYKLGGPEQIPFYTLLGFITAPIGAAFTWFIYQQQDFWHNTIHLSRPLKTGLAGVLVGLVGIYLPEILGTGHEMMETVFNSGEKEIAISFLLILVVAKSVMTSISLAGGFVGGIFAPSLFMGAMLGSAYGRILETVLPDMSIGNPAAYAIAGMGAMMAGIVHAPITAILLIFELTNDYQMILPIMLTTVVCVYVAERIEEYGIYALGLKRQGFHLKQGRDVDVMQSVHVHEVMELPEPTIRPESSLKELRNVFRNAASRALCVCDKQERLVGIVTMSDLQRAYEKSQEAGTGQEAGPGLHITVADILTGNLITIAPDEPVWSAIRVMGRHDFETLPVVSSENPHKLLGLLHRRDIMRAYSLAVRRKWESQYIQTQIRLNNLVDETVIECRIPKNSPIAGKSVRDIDWIGGSLLVSIRRNDKAILPHGNTILYPNDEITIMTYPEYEHRVREMITGNHE